MLRLGLLSVMGALVGLVLSSCGGVEAPVACEVKCGAGLVCDELLGKCVAVSTYAPPTSGTGGNQNTGGNQGMGGDPGTGGGDGRRRRDRHRRQRRHGRHVGHGRKRRLRRLLLDLRLELAVRRREELLPPGLPARPTAARTAAPARPAPFTPTAPASGTPAAPSSGRTACSTPATSAPGAAPAAARAAARAAPRRAAARRRHRKLHHRHLGGGLAEVVLLLALQQLPLLHHRLVGARQRLRHQLAHQLREHASQRRRVVGRQDRAS